MTTEILSKYSELAELTERINAKMLASIKDHERYMRKLNQQKSLGFLRYSCLRTFNLRKGD